MRSKCKNVQADSRAANLSTQELASALNVEEQTPRASLCRHGHWMGLVPVKLPNGRLLWSAAGVERLLSGSVRDTKGGRDE